MLDLDLLHMFGHDCGASPEVRLISLDFARGCPRVSFNKCAATLFFKKELRKWKQSIFKFICRGCPGETSRLNQKEGCVVLTTMKLGIY